MLHLPSEAVLVGFLASLPACLVALGNIFATWKADRRAAAERAVIRHETNGKLDHIEKLTNSSMSRALIRIDELEAIILSMQAERLQYLGSLRQHPENQPPTSGAVPP